MHRFSPLVASLLWRSLALVAFCCVLGNAMGEEARERKRSYNLPRGDASTTLNQFAAASERHIIFMVAKVRGVQTNAVVGEYLPAEALEQMLVNTELRGIAEPDSGSFVVTRREAGGAGHLAKAGNPTNPETAQPMKRPNVLRRVAAALSLLAANQTEAQSATPPPEAKEEILTLSPFQVNVADEKGYVATSSLVGSRVNTELKDIASQIDVLTPEFLQDIGADSIADAVLYSSNFGGPNALNQNGNDGIAAGAGSGAATVNVEGRARGMDPATVSTDFFTTNLPVDFYNIERLNLAYGAQSILFGLGNAGGVLDSSTKRALMRNRGTLGIKFDSWGSWRQEIDFNRILIPQKMAMRLVGLNSDAEQFTRGGHTKSLRGFGTLTFKPFANTTVRAGYEQIDVSSQRASNFLAADFVTPWINAGRALFDNSRGNASITATDPVLAAFNNQARIFSYGVGGESTRRWQGSAIVKGRNQLPGTTDQGAFSLVDNSIYPTDLDPRVSSRQNDVTGRQIRAAIEQKITSDFFVELGFSREERDERAGGTFDAIGGANDNNSFAIHVDPNRYLPGGTAALPVTALNSNAGRLYLEAAPHGVTRSDITQEARITAFYEFDARKRLGERLHWLGRHRLAGLLSTREDRNENQEDVALAVGNTSFTTGNKQDISRQARFRYYLDSPSDPNSKGNYLATAAPGSGIFGPWTVTDTATNTPVTYAMFDNPEGSFNSPVGTKLKDDSAMAALQSFFWHDKINLFVGLRRDHVKTYVFDSASTTRRGQVTPTDQLGLFPRLSEARYKSTANAVKTSDLRTFGAVYHVFPWLSMFYNTSENTSLPPGLYGPSGKPLDGTSSNGYDYGFRLGLLKDRVSVRVNFYQDNQKGFPFNPFQGLVTQSNAIEQRLRGSDRPAGIGTVPASTFDPIANPVSIYRSTADKTAEGLDVVMVANLTSNWTLRATVGQQENLVKQRGREWMQWIQDRLPVWRDAGGRGWDNVTITSTSALTIHQHYDQQIATTIASLSAASGAFKSREREWRANAFTNYRFTADRWKGLNLGGGIRWSGRGFTGQGAMTIPGLAAPVDDINVRYLHAKAQTFVDLLVGYRRRLNVLNHPTNLNFQVNVRNALDEDDREVTRTLRSGVDFEYARVDPRQFVFSASVEF